MGWYGSDAFNGTNAGASLGAVTPIYLGNPQVGGTALGSRAYDLSKLAIPSFPNTGPSQPPFYVRTPGRSNFDISFFKNFNITETTKLQFRTGLFNVFPVSPVGVAIACFLIVVGSIGLWSYIEVRPGNKISAKLQNAPPVSVATTDQTTDQKRDAVPVTDSRSDGEKRDTSSHPPFVAKRTNLGSPGASRAYAEKIEKPVPGTDAVIEQNQILPAQRGIASDLDADSARHLEQVEMLLRSFKNGRLLRHSNTLDLTYESRLSKDLLVRNVLLRRDAELAKAHAQEQHGVNRLTTHLAANADLDLMPGRGLDHLIDSLPNGIETRLGKMFSGGTDISIGQWQRLAIARADAGNRRRVGAAVAVGVLPQRPRGPRRLRDLRRSREVPAVHPGSLPPTHEGPRPGPRRGGCAVLRRLPSAARAGADGGAGLITALSNGLRVTVVPRPDGRSGRG